MHDDEQFMKNATRQGDHQWRVYKPYQKELCRNRDIVATLSVSINYQKSEDLESQRKCSTAGTMLSESVHSMRGGFIFRSQYYDKYSVFVTVTVSRRPSLKVHHGQCLTTMTKHDTDTMLALCFSVRSVLCDLFSVVEGSLSQWLNGHIFFEFW